MQTLLLILLIGDPSMQTVHSQFFEIALLFNFSENHFVRFHLKFLALIMVELP